MSSSEYSGLVMATAPIVLVLYLGCLGGCAYRQRKGDKRIAALHEAVADAGAGVAADSAPDGAAPDLERSTVSRVEDLFLGPRRAPSLVAKDSAVADGGSFSVRSIKQALFPSEDGGLESGRLGALCACRLKFCGFDWRATSEHEKANTVHAPLVVPLFIFLVVILYYAPDSPCYQPAPVKESPVVWMPGARWYTCLTNCFAHIHGFHLWGNVLMLAVGGGLSEMTEGVVRTFAVMFASQVLGMGLHAAKGREVKMNGETLAFAPVVGASGIAYGLLWLQLAILSLNWEEMPLRWIQLTAMLLLLAADVYLFATGAQGFADVAIDAHLGGALAACAVGVILAVNIRRRLWELAFNWAGIVSYTAFILYLLLKGRTVTPFLAGLLYPILVAQVYFETRRAHRERNIFLQYRDALRLKRRNKLRKVVAVRRITPAGAAVKELAAVTKRSGGGGGASVARSQAGGSVSVPQTIVEDAVVEDIDKAGIGDEEAAAAAAKEATA